MNILNSCPTQGWVEGWDVVKPQYSRSVSSKGAGRPRLTHHHKGGWNETKWMRWVWRKWWNEICGWGKLEKPVKNLPRPCFVHHETHMEGPRRELGTPVVGGERLTACATRPPFFVLIYSIIIIKKYKSHLNSVAYQSLYCFLIYCKFTNSHANTFKVGFFLNMLKYVLDFCICTLYLLPDWHTNNKMQVQGSAV